jgi:carbon storage regulator
MCTGSIWFLKEEGVMLVLSRKLGQSFHVGHDVRVTIVKIDRNSIRIGIDAPDHISIQREEIVFEMPELESQNQETVHA